MVLRELGKQYQCRKDNPLPSQAETLPDPMFRLSDAGRVVYVSPASPTLLRYTPQQCTPYTYLQYIAPDDQALAEQSFRLLLSGGRSVEVVLQLIRRDRVLIRAFIHATPWFDGAKIIGVQGCIRDIVEQKRVKEPLSRGNGTFNRRLRVVPHREARQDVQVLERLLDTIAAGIGILCQGKFRYCNAQMARLTGYPVSELLDMQWSRLFAAEPDATGMDLTRVSAEPGLLQAVECRWQRKDGTFVDVFCSIVPFAGNDPSRSLELSVTVFDITASKQAAQKLQTAYTELDQIFNVTVPLCLLSLECRVLKANKAFCDFFSRSPEEVLGQTGRDIWHCLACHTEQCSLKQLQAGASMSSLEIDQVVQGRHLVCTLHAAPYVDAAGRLNGSVVTFVDGQTQKKISADLLKTRQQLIQAEKLSAIGSLAASIAHEFNNPLCGVHSVMERMARKPELTSGDQGLVELALEQCDRMKRLAKDLQQFNRPFSDVRNEFDLHRAIDSVLLLLHKYLQIRKAVVRKEYAVGAVLLTGAESQIKQVLLNLVKSSGEALPETGGEIRIQTRKEAGKVYIMISDTGIGISEKDLPHLFEPFLTTKSAVKETGLDLSVSYGIIKGHQGEILGGSILGKGTTFTVILPTAGNIAGDEGRE